MYKIFPKKIIGSGLQGKVYLTCKNSNKEDCNYATKIPVNDIEIRVSKIMSKNKLGPKIYKVYDCKTEKDIQNITSNGEELLLIRGKCMVMEKLIGIDMAHLAENENIFITEKFANLLITKIRKFHKIGWHHGDLYAQNIFVILNKEQKPIDIKIIDFGRAEPIERVNYVEDFKDLLETLNKFGKYNMDNIRELIVILEREVILRKEKDKKRIEEKIKRRMIKK